MRLASLTIAIFLAACGGDGTSGAGGGTGAGTGGGSAAKTCSGTHVPCSTYDGKPQECLNHGCSVNGSSCQGTPHTCESMDPFACGQAHGCDACDFCEAGTVCVHSCLLGGVYSPRTDCVPSTMTCTSCTEQCAVELCGEGANCAEGCFVPTPGAFQCVRQP